jgi:hypothetical protein
MTELLQEVFPHQENNVILLIIKIGHAVFGRDNYVFYMTQREIKNGRKKPINLASF